jgi:type I restriction enzyme S subunit
VNICEPFSYVNGNAMSLDNLSPNVDYIYLAYFLKKRGLNDIITGTAQPQIIRQSLNKIKIPLPPLAEQQRIAALLDKADALRRTNRQILDKYDQLAQSVFLEMFGDPVTNPKGWEKEPTIKYCDCIVPGRDKPKSFTGNIPWVTTEDINNKNFTTKSKKNIGLSISEITNVKAKIIPPNSVIMTCVGDLGVVTVNKKEIVVNQQLHTFQCGEKINPIFLMYNLSYQKPYMYKMATNTTVPYMNKTVCNNTPTILPPITLQNKFATVIEKIEQQKELAGHELQKSEELFQSLLQEAFRG